MPQAYRHNPRKPSAVAVAAVRKPGPAAPAAALTTLIVSVLLTLLAQAGWMPLT